MTVKELIEELKNSSRGNLNLPVVVESKTHYTTDVTVGALCPKGLLLKQIGCITISGTSWANWKRQPRGFLTSEKYLGKPKKYVLRKASDLLKEDI